MASKFTRQFQKELISELKNKVKTYRVYQKERWLTIKGKRVVLVDIFMESTKRLVLIEIESHRQDPSNNIAKILFWLKHHHLIDKEILVIQLFSPFYHKHKVKREISEELGKLIMEKFRGKVVYKSLLFSPKFNFNKFEKIYSDPNNNEKWIKILSQETAESIVKLL